MQISALSTIIAAQQARSAGPAARPAAAAPAAKPAVAATPPVQDFAPLAFAAQTSAMTATEDTPPRPAYPANAPLGSQVDIRV
jgi:hypothetical protein